MPIREGDSLPDATLLEMGENGPEEVRLSDRLAGRKVVIFGLPGAFTGTCTAAHVPSFIRTAADFRDKGVDEIVCLAVNDPFVMKAWSEQTGAGEAGITHLADPSAEFTRAVDMAFTAPKAGFYDRSKRYAMMVEDGTVRVIRADENPGTCDISGGESLLAAI